jgi:hypothetical protein
MSLNPQFEGRDAVQHVVAVVQVVCLLHPERPGYSQIVTLVGEHALADSSRSSMVIVRGADQIPGVPFLNQFEHQPASEDGEIVGMWLNGSEDFSRVRLPWLSALNLNFSAGKRPFVGHRTGCRNGECSPRNSPNKLAALHRTTS